MIVLHVLSRSLAANCAETVLLRKHLVEVLGGYPVTASQMVSRAPPCSSLLRRVIALWHGLQ
jgi:hypothetical protein